MSGRSIWGLYVITPEGSGHNRSPLSLVAQVRHAIDGGARVVQYRDKSSDPIHRMRDASGLAELCRARGIPFLINDDPELARVVGADGVHLGADDATLREARMVLGTEAIIGISCYDRLDMARQAEAGGADYVAFGSFFPSSTKPDAVRASLELLQHAREALDIPIVAIGGISPENGGKLIDAGANALAVIDGVFGQSDILVAAQRFARLFDGVNKKQGNNNATFT